VQLGITVRTTATHLTTYEDHENVLFGSTNPDPEKSMRQINLFRLELFNHATIYLQSFKARGAMAEGVLVANT